MSKNNILISFLIPLYNCGETVKRCINSFVSQFDNTTEKIMMDYEISVVNDGYLENVEKIVKQLQKKIIILDCIHKIIKA